MGIIVDWNSEVMILCLSQLMQMNQQEIDGDIDTLLTSFPDFSFFVCSFDNSDYQRNGDYFPTRLNVQKDGINLIGLTKVRSNPENNVGLLTYAR